MFGTVELIVPAGAGAGEGPNPVWKPDGSNYLQVQVIGQQWQFTYRYPQFGGMETTQLVLPANRSVAFHVTSLDVIHSFWAYQLAVKADANPGVDNVAYTTTDHVGGFTVRCSELCGIWHGAMFDSGQVVTPSVFQVWATRNEQIQRRKGVLAALPPYATTYDPTVIPNIGKVLIAERDHRRSRLLLPAERPGDAMTAAPSGRQAAQPPGDAGNGSPGRHCDEEVTGCPSR